MKHPAVSALACAHDRLAVALVLLNDHDVTGAAQPSLADLEQITLHLQMITTELLALTQQTTDLNRRNLHLFAAHPDPDVTTACLTAAGAARHWLDRAGDLLRQVPDAFAHTRRDLRAADDGHDRSAPNRAGSSGPPVPKETML